MNHDLIDRGNALYSSRFDRDLLDRMMNLGDPLADEAALGLDGQARRPADGPAAYLEQLRHRAQEGNDEAVRFFDTVETRPSWFDPEAIARGQQVAAACAPLLGLSLVHSLYAGAVFPRATIVTGMTGRLGSEPERRVRETAAFITALLEPGSLVPGRAGFDTAVRVRLLHALIRRWVADDEAIGPLYAGTPIDQTMLAMTNGLFSYLNVRSLRRMGFAMGADDEVAHHHLWRYVGHLLGIHDHLLPECPQAEAELWSALVAHQARPEVLGIDHLDYSARSIARLLPGGRISHHSIRDLLIHLSGPGWWSADAPTQPQPRPTLGLRALQSVGASAAGAYRWGPGGGPGLAKLGRQYLHWRLGSQGGPDYGVRMAPSHDPEETARALVAMCQGVEAHLAADRLPPASPLGLGPDAGADPEPEAPQPVPAGDRASLHLSRFLYARPTASERLLGRTRWGSPFAPDLTPDPYPFYERIRADGPMVWNPLYRQWFVTGFDEAKLLLTSPQMTVARQPQLVLACRPHTGLSAASRELMRHFLLFVDPPRHTRLRKLISAAFTVRRIAELEDTIGQRATDLIDRLGSTGDVDLFRDFNQPLPLAVIADLFGLDDDDLPFIGELSLALTTYLNPLADPGSFAGIDATLNRGIDYFTELVEQRRATPGPDLISAMVEVEEDDQRFDQAEIVALAMFVMFAGHETTSGVLGSALVALHRFPHQRRLLRERPELWPNAVEELIRYDPAIQFDPRTAVEDFLVGNQTVRRGQNIVIALGAANRDPRHVDRPDELDIERDDIQSLSFGHGPHFCLGAALARLELRIGLRALVEHFPHSPLDLDRVTWKRHPVLRGPTRLPLMRP